MVGCAGSARAASANEEERVSEKVFPALGSVLEYDRISSRILVEMWKLFAMTMTIL